MKARQPSRTRGRGYGNASPVNGQQADLQLRSWKKAELGEEQGAVVRACETPEFFALHGCPHGRGPERGSE